MLSHSGSELQLRRVFLWSIDRFVILYFFHLFGIFYYFTVLDKSGAPMCLPNTHPPRHKGPQVSNILGNWVVERTLLDPMLLTQCCQCSLSLLIGYRWDLALLERTAALREFPKSNNHCGFRSIYEWWVGSLELFEGCFESLKHPLFLNWILTHSLPTTLDNNCTVEKQQGHF